MLHVQEERIAGKTWPGNSTFWSEMELKIVEPQKSPPPVKQWMIGAHQQSLKSKVDSFSEIFRSPVPCLETHDDVSPPNTDFVFQNTTLYSVRDYFNNITHKRHPSEVKPMDSTSSQTKVLDKHTKTEEVIFPQSAGRQERVTEQGTLCSGDETTESAVCRLQNRILNGGLQFGSDPVEYLAKISPPDFPRARHGSSLDSNVVSSDLHNEVSHPSICNSHPFSPEGTQFLSTEVLEFCNLKGKKGLTEMCTVESVLHDIDKDLGTVRNLEGVKDLPIQTNTEREKRMAADSVNATPLPDLSPSSSLIPGEPLQTQHEALYSPEYSNVKGPHAGITEEAGAVVLCARQSFSKTKPEMKTIEKLRVGVKPRKGAKPKKEEEKTGSERMRGLLAVTRAKTRGRMSTGNPELLIKVPYGSLDSRGKFERTSPNKAIQMSFKHGFGSQTESGREGEKDMTTSEQFVAAPVMGKKITETVVNKSAVAITNYHDYSGNTRSGKVTITTCVNTDQTGSNTMGNVGYGRSSSVNARSSRIGKAVSKAELESSALLDAGIWSSKYSMTQSAIVSDSIEREEKEGEINALFGDQELTKISQLGVQSRGHQFYLNRKRRIELQSVGNPQCSDVEETIVQVLQSDMAEESPGNAMIRQGNGLQRRTQQRRNNNCVVKNAKEEGSLQDTVKPMDSTSSQTKVLDKHTKTEEVIFPQSAGRQERVTEQGTLCSGDETTESEVCRLQNRILNGGLQFGSDPVEYLAKISPPDFPRARHGSSLDSDVVSSDLHNEVSHPSICNSHPFSPEGTQFLSTEVLEFCNLKEKKGLTEMCTVKSVLHDMDKDLGTVRNLEGVKDLPIQTNTEREKRMAADSANATPLPDLSPRSSLMPGEPLQTQHEALYSPEYSNVKGPHAGITEEAGAVVLCARQSFSKTKPEVKTIEKLRVGVNPRKGAKPKKEEEKTGSERMRGLLAVTRAKTRGRMSTGNPELLIKVPYGSLDSRVKFERTSPNKAIQMSFKHGFGSQTESGREGEKDMTTSEQFVAAPVMGKKITETVVNKSAVTEMCTVKSVLYDMDKDLGTVRNLEGVKDLPIQTNTEREKRMAADSANATLLPDLSPRSSLMPGEPLQTQHEALYSPEYSNVKGPHAGITEEAGAVVLCARQSFSKTKPEVKTIEKLRVGVNTRKGAKPKKEEEKTGSERMRGLLAVTRAKTRGRMSTGNPELLIKVPYGSLDSRGKFERTSPNKTIRMSFKHGFGSQTESGGEGEKDMTTSEQFVAAPVMGKKITETVVNKSAVAITNDHDYSGNTRSGKVTITTCVNTDQTGSNTMGNVGYGRSSSVNPRSSRIGKALSKAELESSALLDGGIWSSKYSMTQSAIASDSIEREEKEGEINALFGDQELTQISQLGVQSRGHQFYLNRKRRIELQSVGNPQCSDVEETIVQVLQSDMAEESPGNATIRQGNGLQRRTQQRRNNNCVVKNAKEEGSLQDTDIYNEVVKGDEEGILFSREFQREWVPEQEIKYDVKHYLKEACKIRTVSVQGKERLEKNSSSKSNLVSPKSQGQCESTVNKPSDLHLGSDVDCSNLKGISTREFTPISLPVQAGTRPLIPVHSSGKSVSMQNNKEDNEKGGTPYILSIPSMDTSPKSCNVEIMEGERKVVLLKSGNLSSSNENCLRDGKGRKLQQRKRKAGTYKRKDRCSRGGKDAPIVMKEQNKDNLVAISGSSPLRSCLKRRHSCPEIKHISDSSRTAHMLASSPLGRLPCSPVYHFSRALPRPSSVKRSRRHTVSSLEVEREIAPLCLRKEVYPIGWRRLCGSTSYLCPNLTFSPKALATGFLASPLAFLSSKLQGGSVNIANRGSNSHNITSSSSWSFATPTPSCPATSSVCHPLFPATTSSVPTNQSSASVSSFCSVPSLREHELKQEDAEENSCFRLDLDIQERCEEKSLSDSEIKMKSMKQGEHGKVSRIKIRKTLPKPPTNLTPMGLPKPVRLKKKEFSLEEIYTNKNFHEPPAGRLETIFEVPMSGRDGSVSVTGQRRIKRFVEFPEVGMPRKPRRPVVRTGVSRKAVESSNLARTRRGGNDRAKEGCVLSLQKIEAILCSKLEQLDTWIALEENGLSV